MGDQVREIAEAFVYLRWEDGRPEYFRLDAVDAAPRLAEYRRDVDVVEGEHVGNCLTLLPGPRQSVSLTLSGRGPNDMPPSDAPGRRRWRCSDPTHPLHGMEMVCSAGRPTVSPSQKVHWEPAGRHMPTPAEAVAQAAKDYLQSPGQLTRGWLQEAVDAREAAERT